VDGGTCPNAVENDTQQSEIRLGAIRIGYSVMLVYRTPCLGVAMTLILAGRCVALPTVAHHIQPSVDQSLGVKRVSRWSRPLFSAVCCLASVGHGYLQQSDHTRRNTCTR